VVVVVAGADGRLAPFVRYSAVDAGREDAMIQAFGISMYRLISMTLPRMTNSLGSGMIG
jgi:hypothetical protein